MLWLKKIKLDKLKPLHLIISGVVFSLILSKDENPAELNVIGNWIVAVGGLILTIAAQQELILHPEAPVAIG